MAALQAKYQPVLDLGEKLNVTDGFVKEEDGKLKMGGTVETQYQKNLLWDKIKEVGGDSPTDISADIRVNNTDYYAMHEVQKGESLSLISKHYYGDAMKYNSIFAANRDKLDNPDLIHPGQQLVIPNL
ncbi:MAG: LysM peptidoglycan-binding domain-containing protein [Bacteroidota bacterium]